MGIINPDPPGTRDNPFSNLNIPYGEKWPEYIKTVPTRMLRMPKPFYVQTSESQSEDPFYCEDGYLAIDARGYPYAIAADEHEKIYKLLEGTEDNSPINVSSHEEITLSQVRFEALVWACKTYENSLDANLIVQAAQKFEYYLLTGKKLPEQK